MDKTGSYIYKIINYYIITFIFFHLNPKAEYSFYLSLFFSLGANPISKNTYPVISPLKNI